MLQVELSVNIVAATAPNPPVIYGMAADSVGRTLYFTDRANSIIGSLSLDGGGTVHVVTTTGFLSNPLPWPWPLTPDSCSGLMWVPILE
jgi:hypothetical protein